MLRSQATHLLSWDGTQTANALQKRCPACTRRLAPQLNRSRRLRPVVQRVAKPRHDEAHTAEKTGTGSWDEDAPEESDQDASSPNSTFDWAKVQSFAALLGASTLLAVATLQLSGKADLPDLALNKLPETVQDALPQLQEDKGKSPLGQFNLGAAIPGFKEEDNKQKGSLSLPFLQQDSKQQESSLSLPFNRPDKSSDDWKKAQQKVQNERQQARDKPQQKRGAKSEQSRTEREKQMQQREKDKEQQTRQRAKEREEAERREKERKEKERKEKEKRKKFRDQALVGGSIFGVSALTFGKWQLVASLGAVVFRTLGGPSITASVLRTPGYIIGRGMRVVEWDVSQCPSGPTGDLRSLKLRALTPDGIRIAIAKEYGLSNYREVRQVSHWVTNTKPYFFEPMRTAAAFKMLPDPAFVVWSKHPPTGHHKLPNRSEAPQPADTGSADPLEGLTSDQVVAVMLKAISGVAIASRRQTPVDWAAAQASVITSSGFNGVEHQSSGTASQQHDAKQQVASDVHAANHSSNGHKRTQHAASNEAASPQHAPGTASNDQRQQQQQQQGAVSVMSREEHSQHSSSAQVSNGQPQHAHESGVVSHTNGLSQEGSDKACAVDGKSNISESWHKTESERANERTLHQQAPSGQNSSNGHGSPSQTAGAPSKPLQSEDDEVAGVLQKESDTNSQSEDRELNHTEPPDHPLNWADVHVLRCLSDRSHVSADYWGEQLQLPDTFQVIPHDEEDRLVMSACQADNKLVPLFQAYAPHNILTFVRFARMYCSRT